MSAGTETETCRLEAEAQQVDQSHTTLSDLQLLAWAALPAVFKVSSLCGDDQPEFRLQPGMCGHKNRL